MGRYAISEKVFILKRIFNVGIMSMQDVLNSPSISLVITPDDLSMVGHFNELIPVDLSISTKNYLYSKICTYVEPFCRDLLYPKP